MSKTIFHQCWNAQQGKTCGACESKDLADCWVITPPSSICSPPAAKTESDQGLAALSDSEQVGGHSFLVSCPYPLPFFVPPAPYLTGQSWLSDLREGFRFLDSGPLDAPLYVASGGVDSLLFDGQLHGFSFAYRGGDRK